MESPGPGAEPSGRPRGEPSRAILLVTHSHYPDDPRAQKHALALTAAGFDVTVLCLRRGDERPTETIERVRVRRLPVEHKRGGGGDLGEYLRFYAMAAWEIAGISLRGRPFAIQVNNPPDFLVFVTLLPKLLGARVVLDMHEPVPELFASIRKLPRGAPAVRLVAWVERLATRYADRVVTVSEACRKTFAARGTPERKITVVRNVSDLSLFDARRFPRPAGDGDFRVFYHGTLVPRYGVDVALRAIALLSERLPEARLVIYGRGVALEDLRRQAAELGIADRVSFHGQVDLALVPEKLAAADVGVVPNRRDLFMDLVLPTKLFEYIAMGKPAVVSRTAAVLDFFGEEDLYLFEPEDAEGLARALLAVRDDPAGASARAARLRERSAHATWEVERDRLVALYRELAGDRPEGPR